MIMMMKVLVHCESEIEHFSRLIQDWSWTELILHLMNQTESWFDEPAQLSSVYNQILGLKPNWAKSIKT